MVADTLVRITRYPGDARTREPALPEVDVEVSIQKTSHMTYQQWARANHYAPSWDSTATVLVGPANIRETVTVGAGGNHYSGTFSLDQFATDGKTALAHVVGTVSATRITVD